MLQQKEHTDMNASVSVMNLVIDGCFTFRGI